MNYKVFIIGKKPVTAQNEIPVVVSDQTVSRQHARLTYENGTFYLEDLNSLNKTYVNGQEIRQKTPVSQSDTITLGRKVPFGLSHPVIIQNINAQEPGISPMRNFEYATWGSRLGGYLLDGLFFSLLTAPIYAAFYGIQFLALTNSEMSLTIIGAIILIAGTLLAFHFYFAVAINQTGNTWGKRIVNVKVINADTKKYPSKGQVWGRYLAYYVSAFILMIGFFMPLWTEKRQALHDLMANTLVIKSNN
jgi:uncharacterized RDD family membrane protein YckC